MSRRWAILVAIVALLAVGVGGWYAYTRYLSTPPDRALVGLWEGKGQSTGEGTIGNEKVTLSFTSTSKVEFRPDGTYTWEAVASSGGEGGQMTVTLSVPKDGQPAPTWEVVRKDGRTYLMWHLGESELDFHGNDSFTIKWSQPNQVGSETYRRVPGKP